MTSKIVILFILCAFYTFTTASFVNGSVKLSSAAFSKVIGAFKWTLIKVDEVYPYGDKHEAFKALAAATSQINDLLVAELGVAEYGDKENLDLAERFKLTRNDYPVYFLFSKGNSADYKSKFSGNHTNVEEIKSWVSRETGFWIGLEGLIESLDKLVSSFVGHIHAGSKAEATQSRKAAEAEAARLTAEGGQSEEQKEQAEYYAKTMARIEQKGEMYVESELTRLGKLIEGRISEAKKRQLRLRLNILTSFHSALVTLTADAAGDSKQEL